MSGWEDEVYSLKGCCQPNCGPLCCPTCSYSKIYLQEREIRIETGNCLSSKSETTTYPMITVGTETTCCCFKKIILRFGSTSHQATPGCCGCGSGTVDKIDDSIRDRKNGAPPPSAMDRS
jgi:hypothetical protein